jgi:hypothetical protein
MTFISVPYYAGALFYSEMYVNRHASLGSWLKNWKAYASVSCLLAGCDLGSELFGSSTSYVVDTTGESVMTTWSCTGSPCPWGDEVANHAIAWPSSATPVVVRHGYTASPAPYLPAAEANGLTISIEFGSANVFAGEPLEASHHFLATVSPGQSYDVSGLGANEVLSVQSDNGFGYHVAPTPVDPPDDDPPDDPPDDDPPDDDPPDDPPPGDGTESHLATWTCTGAPCPWGNSLTGHAIAWTDDEHAISARLGYTVSADVYLRAAAANGAEIEITGGTASAYAGPPGAGSHRWLGDFEAGDTIQISGLAESEVLSVQSDGAFTFEATLPPPPEDEPEDPDPGEMVHSVSAFWRCNTPGCVSSDWTGAVINWSSLVAHHTNARSGEQSRSVFDAGGSPLYPYMGAWAEGCKVTAVSGIVLVIEWERGTDTWRETWLEPGQSHTIHLTSPEDGAMIESHEGSTGFTAGLKNCTPQPLDP